MEAWWERQQKWEEANTATEGAAVLLEELHCLVAAKPIYAMGTCEGFAALGLANGHVVLCSLSPLRELFSFEAHAAAVSVSPHCWTRGQQTQPATPYTPGRRPMHAGCNRMHPGGRAHLSVAAAHWRHRRAGGPVAARRGWGR